MMLNIQEYVSLIVSTLYWYEMTKLVNGGCGYEITKMVRRPNEMATK